ncbi:Single-stranded DNA-binding protein 3 [Mactra antiquata]
MAFANTFYVAPNTIDFTTVFLKFSPLNQAAVMGTLIGIGVLYFIGVIVLRRFDKADRLKWGMTPLCDNVVTDTQFYIIKVYTGMRNGGGTNSPIAFNLKGTRGETGPRTLSDGIRQGFARGSCMVFFMATNAWLGPLEYLSVWHDHDEDQQFESWYLNQVVIIDVSKEQVYTFVAEQWLSVKTSVYINVCSNTTKEPLSFEARFFHQTRNRLSEGHMWASIFYRPQFSVFTRVQRLSCALVYILLNMIANAMYFNPEPNYVEPALLVVGPIRFTSQQIYVSVISALITTPPVMLLVVLFSRTRARAKSRQTCCCCFRCCCCCSTKHRYSRYDNMTQSQSFNNQTKEDKLQTKLLSDTVPEYYGKLFLPTCFVYINWCIVAGGVAAPAFFVMLYSMEWGKQKSEEWLTSFFMSLIESAIVVDPVMVVCVALILAIVQRVHAEKSTTDIVEIVRKYRKMIAGKLHRGKQVSAPLGKRLLDSIRRKKEYQSEVSSSLRDILLAIFFLWLVSSIAYSARDDRSYRCHSEIINTIVKPYKMPQFNLMKTPGDIYTWLNVSVFPSLFPEVDYNGRLLEWTEKDFTTGQNNIRVGPPRLRQLRSKKDKCWIPYFGEVECNHRYSLINEDTDSYCIGWNQGPCQKEENIFQDSSAAWKFTSALDVWGLPLTGQHCTYSGGGYIVTFDVSLYVTRNILKELFNNIWLNRQTRAVVFEFTLYNPGVNIFIYNEFLIEFPESGGTLTSYNVYPMRLYDNHGGEGHYTLICQILFVLCLFVLMVKICVRFYQQGSQYFGMFWQVYELLMFATGVTAIVAFFIRLGLTFLTISKFEENKRRFVNFAHIVLWDQIYVTLLGVLIFMATLRIIQTFSASKRINAIVRIFKDCGKPLFWFSTCFIYLLIGFGVSGLFLFGSQLESYVSVYKSLTTLLLAMIGKSKFSEIDEMQPVLAKIFFSFYIITVVFFTMTIFFSILGGSIDNIVHGIRTDGDADLLDYMAEAMKRLIKKPKAAVGKKAQSKVSFTQIEKIYINGSPPPSRPQTPVPPSDGKIWISGGDNPALVWRPHPFCRFRTFKVQQKCKQGQTVFMSE